jgi:hypothetical protein
MLAEAKAALAWTNVSWQTTEWQTNQSSYAALGVPML